MDIQNLNLQGATVQQQNIGDNATLTQTNQYAVPPEHQAAVEETALKIQTEVEKPEPSIQTILNDVMALAWKNTPAFLAMLKMWIFK